MLPPCQQDGTLRQNVLVCRVAASPEQPTPEGAAGHRGPTAPCLHTLAPGSQHEPERSPTPCNWEGKPEIGQRSKL